MSLPDHLLERLRAGRVVPFVGAGVSMSVRRLDGRRAFPSWEGLLSDGAAELERLGLVAEATEVRDALAATPPDYAGAASSLRASLADDHAWAAWLRGHFDVDRAEFDPTSFALPRALWDLGRRLIVTTNYEGVLQWSFPAARPPESWVIDDAKDRIADFLGNAIQTPVVWHLHGAISQPESVILSPEDYARLYQDASPDHEAARHALRTLFAKDTVLFVGFSLDDPSVRGVLGWAHRVFERRPDQGNHYLLVKASEEAAFKEKLRGLPVEFIPFDDYGAPLLALVQEIGRSRTHLPASAPPAEGPIALGQLASGGAVEHPPRTRGGRRRLTPIQIVALGLALIAFAIPPLALLLNPLAPPEAPPPLASVDWVYLPSASYPLEPEDPDQTMEIPGFCLARTEVSVGEYLSCVRAGACGDGPLTRENGCNDQYLSGRSEHPINCITWGEALTFARWIGARLPWEGEWALAARGPELRRYPWGNEPEPSCDRACYHPVGRSVGPGCNTDATCPRGAYPKGASVDHGILDLAGNVSEWMADVWVNGTLTRPRGGDILPGDGSQLRVLRGYGFYDNLKDWRKPQRLAQSRYRDDLGFRLAGPPELCQPR